MEYKFKLVRSRLYLATIFLLLLAFACTAFGQEATTADRVESTRVLLEKWVETSRLISKERQDWALGKELLKERLDLIQQEIDSFKKRISEADKSLSELDKSKVDLAAESLALESAGKILEDSIAPLESRVGKLLSQVPAPLQEKVSALSRRFPKVGTKTKLTLSERFQNVIGVLNATNKYNSEIDVASEVRVLGNGVTAEVTSIYLGISQGYYANRNGDSGGVGYAQNGKWAWIPENDAAKDIAKAIKILKNEEVASYVLLPLKIK